MKPGTYYETFCDDCLTVHWVEVGPPPFNRQTCHGGEKPREDAYHFIRRAPRWNGLIGLELCAKASTPAPIGDWILAKPPAALFVEEIDF